MFGHVKEFLGIIGYVGVESCVLGLWSADLESMATRSGLHLFDVTEEPQSRSDCDCSFLRQAPSRYAASAFALPAAWPWSPRLPLPLPRTLTETVRGR